MKTRLDFLTVVMSGFNLTKKFFKKKRTVIVIIGFISLVWFLIRVIPKPARATYPCQRAAFPLASAFVLWIAGFIGSYMVFKRAGKHFEKAKFGLSFLLIIMLIVIANKQLLSSVKKSANAEIPVLTDFTEGEDIIQPKAVVSIVRSAEERAEDIAAAEIYDMVRRAVEMAGGFDDLIHDYSTVVLKPNLLTASVVDVNFNSVSILPQKVNSVTTDYRIIQAVVNLVREKNPNGKVYVMDGSAIGDVRDNMEYMGWFNVTGVDEFLPLNESCGAWRDTAAIEIVKVSLPEGKALYSTNNKYYLNKIYYEADVLISIPVLKTHSNTAVTGAVKNVGIGATPVNIYGSSSGHPWRFDVIDHGNVSNSFSPLHNWIHDFYLCKPVDFAIMDGLTGMEYGPLSSEDNPYYPSEKNTRCILASSDPIALDAVESLIVQVDPKRVRHLVTLHNDTIGCNDVRCIRINGIRVDEIKERYANMATYATYYDFVAPSVLIDQYQLSGDSVYIDLNADAEVVKVEITVDENFLDPIYINNFNNIVVNAGKEVTDPKQIKIYAYDQYLNCSIIYLDGTSAGLNSVKPVKAVNAYPNPVKDRITIEFGKTLQGETHIFIYDLNGRIVKRSIVSNSASCEMELYGLLKGSYILVLKNGKSVEQLKIVKE